VDGVSSTRSALVIPIPALTDGPSARERLIELAGAWRVVVEDSFETATSFIAYGRRGSQPVVLKVVKRPGDEWRSGEVLSEFDGRGVVRVYEHVAGAVLLERLTPGSSLIDLVLSGRDEEATAIVASVIRAMAPAKIGSPTSLHPTVQDWGTAFAWYASTGDRRISSVLVSDAHRLYDELCRSQTGARLLHGDLQHSNILFDHQRGWVAIDPKGLIGEAEYEIGAALRNPHEAPSLFMSPATIDRRIRQFASELDFDATRALSWAFAQAALSAVWMIEDGATLDAREPCIVLAETIWRMLPSFPQ
jgi:streptomycin 6-kinase